MTHNFECIFHALGAAAGMANGGALMENDLFTFRFVEDAYAVHCATVPLCCASG